MQLTRERWKPLLGRWAGVLVGAVAALLAVGCGGAHGQQSTPASSGTPKAGGPPYVSFTAYPGWIQASIPPSKFDYTPWTIISDFGLWPTATGGIAVGDMQSLANIPPAVADAHKAGKSIIMAVGEQGLGSSFAGGASPRYRTSLVNNIVSYVSRYGFDGVDIDWEEYVPQNRANYVALFKNLRSALDTRFTARHMYLATEVNTGQIPPDIAMQVAPYVDSINVETFQDNGLSSIAAYTRAGIPASKLLLGIGVTSGYYDSTQARVAAKVKYVEDHGLKGTLLWQPGALKTYRTDPRLIPLRQMVSISR
jgi:chitinase